MKNNTKNNKSEFTYTFKVNRSDTLLNFLYSKINNSRNTVKGLLSDHKVLVNGSMTSQFDYPLAKDDEVKISKNRIINTKEKVLEKNKSINDISKLIIYEDEDFIAINKPSGMLSVESDKEKNCALLFIDNYIKSKNPKSRIFQLHRIDKDTSGVLVFTKNIKLHSMLKLNWNNFIEYREYYAVVNGTFENKKDTLVSYLMENVNNIVYSTKNPRAKKAITNYEVIKENKKYSLLKINIETGRKNQIRVQMNDINHPVLGDNKYGFIDSPINRLTLHASRLDFINPITSKHYSINAPVPKEFNEVLK